MNDKVNGFQVKVLDGREITQNQFEQLKSEQHSKVKVQINGPHHNSKWAKHQKYATSLQEQFSRPFGDGKSSAITWSKATPVVPMSMRFN